MSSRSNRRARPVNAGEMARDRLTKVRSGVRRDAGPGAACAAPVLAFAMACALLLLAPSSASAQEQVCGQIRWVAASGAVAGYDVYVEINGGDLLLFESGVEAVDLVVRGPEFQFGDRLRFQVVAFAADGRRGPPSPVSDLIYCDTIPTPQGVAMDEGSLVHPNRLSWQPVPGIDLYEIYRSEESGSLGDWVGETDQTSFEDDEAPVSVTHYYSVVAATAVQQSEPSDAVEATRGTVVPRLTVSVPSLRYDAASGDTSYSQMIELGNEGDWSMVYQAWSTRRWASLSEWAAKIDRDPKRVEVRVDLSALTPGEHTAELLFYSYYDPPPGQDFELGEPLVVPITVSVPGANRAPRFVTPLVVYAREGETTFIQVEADDPDGDRVFLDFVGLPAWAGWYDFGDGYAVLTLSPDYDATGVWDAEVVAWDDGAPGMLTRDDLRIVIEDTNRAPALAPVADQVVTVGQTHVVPLAAFDADLGDRLAFTASSLPGFATLNDQGNGTAEIVLSPDVSDVGSYLIIYGVVDDAASPIFVGGSFQVTVQK
jgi:hypothetical protein